MPEVTNRLGLKKPLGNESVTRQSYNENLDILENNVATKEEIDLLASQQVSMVTAEKNIILISSNWIDDTGASGFWHYKINDAKVDSYTTIDFAVHLTYLEKAKSMINTCESFDGYYRFYAKEQIANDIVLDIKKIKQAGVV